MPADIYFLNHTKNNETIIKKGFCCCYREPTLSDIEVLY